MNKILLLLLLSISITSKGQNSIKEIERQVAKTVDELDSSFSKKGFELVKSNYTRSTNDTALYGMETIWKNKKGELLMQEKDMDYVPLITNGKQVGQSKVLKTKLTLGIIGQIQTNNILNSIKASYKKTGLTAIGDGYEVSYENKNYEVVYRKVTMKHKNLTIYYFIVKAKAYQIVDIKMNN